MDNKYFTKSAFKVALDCPTRFYCELDTMAMVFLWEYFNHECNS